MLFTTLILMVTSNAFGQSNKLDVDLNYPFPFGENFIGKNYSGMADLGLKYTLFNTSKFDIGLSANMGMLGKSDVKVVMMKPRVSTELKLGKINPYMGIGYSLFYYAFDSNSPLTPNSDKTNDGLNMNAGIKLLLTSKLYMNLSYDFIKFRTEDHFDSDYNENIQMFNMGLGLQF